MTKPFWKTKTLTEMSVDEWEGLCDRCGKCCSIKVADGPKNMLNTDIFCPKFDAGACGCSIYPQRYSGIVPCAPVVPGNIDPTFPPSCAYRLVEAGKDLPSWHHLVSGDPESVHTAGKSVRGKPVRSMADKSGDDLWHATAKGEEIHGAASYEVK